MMNESWGVPRLYDNTQQQHFARSLYHLAHGLDPSRLVIANDGWEMTENDICAFHSYKHGSPDNPDTQAAFSLGLQSLSGLESLVERPLLQTALFMKGSRLCLQKPEEFPLKQERIKKLGLF